MSTFNLRNYLIEGRLMSEERFDIDENEDKEEFGFFFPPMRGGISDKGKVEDLLNKNGIDYTDGGMYIIDFKGKNVNWKDMMNLLNDNNIHSGQTYTYR